MPTDYPWYEACSGDGLEQGDFLNDCPVLVPESVDQLIARAHDAKAHVRGVAEEYNLVVLTQTCDLDKMDSNGFVTCCARYDWSEYVGLLPEEYRTNKNKMGSLMSDLTSGRRYGLHLLNSWPDRELEHQVVEFRVVFHLPFHYVKAIRSPTTGWTVS